jgi:hypothetical protein
MMNARLVLALLLTPAALGIAPTLAAAPVPYLPVPHDAAVIMDTGSTNAPGYRIVAQRNGAVEYVVGGVRNRMHADAAKTAQLFSALSAGMPLSSLVAAHCMKSASFGTSLFAYWNHERSPDLTCPGDAKSEAVSSSVSAFVDSLGIVVRIVTPLPGNEPRRVVPTPAPTTSP